VFISPNFPPNWVNFASCLHRLGDDYRVLGVGDEPYDSLSQDLRTNLTEYFRVDSLLDYRQVFQAVAFFSYRYGKIDRLESHTEFWLELDARLRTDFNIDGQKTVDMPHLKRKSLMKEVFRSVGVEVVEGRLVSSREEARAFAHEVGYPIVVKPDIGVGANGAFSAHDDKELDEIPVYDFQGYFAEKFVDGVIETFDGLTDASGKPVFYTSHLASQGIMELLQDRNHPQYFNQRTIPKDLEKIGLRCVQEFGIRERFFHFEFFRTEDDKVYGLEVNARPPGGNTMDLFNYAHDFDLYQIWADMVTGRRDPNTDIQSHRPYHALYLGRKTHFHYAHSEQEIRDRFGHLIAFEQPNHPGLSLLGDYVYIVRTKGEIDELFEFVDFAWEFEDKKPTRQWNRELIQKRRNSLANGSERK